MRHARQKIRPAWSLALLILSVLSCATYGGLEYAPASIPPASLSPIQAKLLEGARAVLGARQLVVRGRRFAQDCTGTVLAIYYHAGIDLSRDFHRYSGGGVVRLYRSLEAEKLLYHTQQPVPGDIIFWDQTWDRNNDGQWNDPLTHMGMVVAVQSDGGIDYIHAHYRRGIIIEHMNLTDPDLHQRLVEGNMVIVNSPMRMKQPGRTHPRRWLASHLYRIFGMGYRTAPSGER